MEIIPSSISLLNLPKSWMIAFLLHAAIPAAVRTNSSLLLDPWQLHTLVIQALCSSQKGCEDSSAPPSLVSMPRLEPGLDGYLCREALLRSRHRIAFSQPSNNSCRDPTARLEIIQGLPPWNHSHFYLALVKIRLHFSPS